MTEMLPSSSGSVLEAVYALVMGTMKQTAMDLEEHTEMAAMDVLLATSISSLMAELKEMVIGGRGGGNTNICDGRLNCDGLNVGTHNNHSYAVVGSRVATPTAEMEGSIVPTVVGKDTTKTVSLCTTA
jgi:hypothetical protein